MRGMGSRILQIWRRTVLLFVVGVLILPAAMVGAQTGGIGGRVANPDPDNPRTQSIFIYTLEHGEAKEDQLLVINRTEEEQTIRLGSVDGVVTNTGDYTCRQEAEPVEDSGGWVELSKTEVVLPAGGEELVDFTVTVPENADVGEHNSCLTLQSAEAEEAVDSATGGGIRLRTRQAIRMIVTIPGDLTRDISIANFMATHNLSGQDYSLTAANRGNVSADIYMRVQLTSIFENQWFTVEGAETGGEYPLVPGESLTREFSTELKPIFGGWYKATPSLRYDKRFGAFGTQNEQASYETITGDSVDMFFWPTPLGWAIIVAIIVLVIALILHVINRAKRRRRLRRGARKHKATKSDTIQSLAEKSQVSWQELAKLNNLSAPYILKEGQEILLPTPAFHTHRKKRRTTKKKK